MIGVRRVVAIGLALVGIAAPAAAGSGEAANETIFVGYAYDRKTDALLYREDHSQITQPDGSVALEVRYVDPRGKAIATYRSEPSGDPLIPDVRFEDHRWGTSEGVRHQDGEIVLFRMRSGSADRVDEKRPTCADRPVADAGLGLLIDRNWDRLLEGESVVAELLIPKRLRCLRFSIAKTDEGYLDGEPVTSFEMKFTNPLIRLLAGPLRFTYHREHRFLMRFEGKSRLVDESGDNYEVRVDFPIAERWNQKASGTTTSPSESGDR
jgi:hypothetical protein